MRPALVLLALAFVAVKGRHILEEGNVTTAILNGRDDKKLGLFDRGRFPYLAQIRYPWDDAYGVGRGTFICAGTLIEPDVILTSAWCAVNAGLLPQVRVNSWVTDAKPGQYESRYAIGVDIHYGYQGEHNNTLAEDNLALLLLNRRCRTKPIGSLPPAFPSPAVPVGTKMSILGWGSLKSNSGPLAENLRGGSQLLHSARTCWKKWSSRRPPVINPAAWPSMKVICASYPGHNKALCRGDQGGPMVRRGTGPDTDMLVGVGVMTNCGGYGDQGGSVYANVPHYEGWIKAGMALLRGRARSQGLHRIVYPKDVTWQPTCLAIGEPCTSKRDCCTQLCHPQYQRCWY